MGQVAFLFPGQGSQKIGMGKDLYESSHIARAVFDEADRTLGLSLTDIMFNGPEDRLTHTAIAQPAILTHSVAVFSSLRAQRGNPEILDSHGLHPEGFRPRSDTLPDFVAGHSLGEYSALVAAGVLSFKDAVKAVHLRGTYMQEAVPLGVGAMAAVLQLDVSIIEEVCKEFSVEIANYNGPDQTVISGTAAGIEKASALLKERGAKRIVPLSVSAPFHCGLMEPAATKLAAHLAPIEFHKPRITFINNVRAESESDPEVIRQLLVEQVTAPVRFTQILTRLAQLGAKDFVEIGPGRVLSGIVRRTLENVNVSNKEN